jgi:indole-3-glycerol phosphate synthase
MNILEQIIAHKKIEVEKSKQTIPISQLEASAYFNRNCHSLVQSLTRETSCGIIAEFKRKSPSKGNINSTVSVREVITAYSEYGAAGISILTDEHFFGGTTTDLQQARQFTACPLLRKEFIIDEYQVMEAKTIGADVILLIAAALTPARVKQLAAVATGLGMEVLLELHDENELEHICDETALVGINNRNLKTFNVDIENSLRLAEKIPSKKIKVAESGIDSPETITLFRENGFNGFLMGEYFMKQQEPGTAFKNFLQQIKKQQ